MPATLHLTQELAGAIRARSAEHYPEECCGALLGKDGLQGRDVLEIFPLVNRREDSPRNRFSITADDFRAAEKVARERGLELLGWYHSHPDHPAQPSDYDRQHAWPWYSYVIVSVAGREPGEMTSWRLADDRSRFEPESVAIGSPASAIAPNPAASVVGETRG